MKKTLAIAGILAGLMALPSQADDVKINGSIPVKDTKENQYPQLAKVTMQDAINAALEKQKGKVVSAELDEEQGFLVYEVTVAHPDGKKFQVFVDAGNRSILAERAKS